MAKRMAPIPVGTRFASDWAVKEIWDCKTSVAHGYGGKNRHYVCLNTKCDVTTVIESSVIKRWITLATKVPNCARCEAACGRLKCFFATEHRHDVSVTPNRTELDTTIGKVYGSLTISGEDIDSKNFTDHQRHVVCDCRECGGKHLMRHDDIRLGNLPCKAKGRSILTVPAKYL